MGSQATERRRCSIGIWLTGADIQHRLEWGRANNAFRKISALMYVIFAVGLFGMQFVSVIPAVA
jgi:hypothetical protein